MFETDILTLAIIGFFAGLLAYKFSFLKNKRLGHFSLLQILYLIVIPGFIYTLIFSYIRSVLERPLSGQIILSDNLLLNIILLSILLAYGGIAIHATSKMLSESLEDNDSKAKEMNSFFHLTLSHNIIYSGAIFGGVGLTLLELNHSPSDNLTTPLTAIIKGILIGSALIAAMYWYNPSESKKGISRWSDLKTTFLASWVGLIIILYGVIKANPSLRESDFVLSMLAAFLVIGSLNMILIYKKLKRGGFKIFLHLGKIHKLLFEIKF